MIFRINNFTALISFEYLLKDAIITGINKWLIFEKRSPLRISNILFVGYAKDWFVYKTLAASLNKLYKQMWVRRSPKEQREVKFKWKSFMFFFLLVFFLKFFSDYLIGEGSGAYVSPPTKPVQLTFQECIDRIPVYLVLSLILGFFCTLIQLSGDKWDVKKNSHKYYCLKCGKMQIDPNQSHCKCGGELVNLNLLKWVEIPEELTEETRSSLN